jgi:hypothetical protein
LAAAAGEKHDEREVSMATESTRMTLVSHVTPGAGFAGLGVLLALLAVGEFLWGETGLNRQDARSWNPQ